MKTFLQCLSYFFSFLAIFWAACGQYNKAAYFMAFAIYVDPK